MNMSLEQKIMAELKTAMLAKDEKSLRSLRAIKAAILLAKTSEGASGDLKEDCLLSDIGSHISCF